MLLCITFSMNISICLSQISLSSKYVLQRGCCSICHSFIRDLCRLWCNYPFGTFVDSNGNIAWIFMCFFSKSGDYFLSLFRLLTLLIFLQLSCLHVNPYLYFFLHVKFCLSLFGLPSPSNLSSSSQLSSKVHKWTKNLDEKVYIEGYTVIHRDIQQ